MASDTEDKLSKTSSSTNTDLSDSRGFQATSTPTGSVKGIPPTRVSSEPDNRQIAPGIEGTTSKQADEKVSGLFSLKKLNETFPQKSNIKGNIMCFNY